MSGPRGPAEGEGGDRGATAVPEGEWPGWLCQFAGSYRVTRLRPGARTGAGPVGSPTLLLRCRWCALALGLDPLTFDPAASPRVVLGLARHGLQHAIDGDLSGADLARLRWVAERERRRRGA